MNIITKANRRLARLADDLTTLLALTVVSFGLLVLMGLLLGTAMIAVFL